MTGIVGARVIVGADADGGSMDTGTVIGVTGWDEDGAAEWVLVQWDADSGGRPRREALDALICVGRDPALRPRGAGPASLALIADLDGVAAHCVTEHGREAAQLAATLTGWLGAGVHDITPLQVECKPCGQHREAGDELHTAVQRARDLLAVLAWRDALSGGAVL